MMSHVIVTSQALPFFEKHGITKEVVGGLAESQSMKERLVSFIRFVDNRNLEYLNLLDIFMCLI